MVALLWGLTHFSMWTFFGGYLRSVNLSCLSTLQIRHIQIHYWVLWDYDQFDFIDFGFHTKTDILHEHNEKSSQNGTKRIYNLLAWVYLLPVILVFIFSLSTQLFPKGLKSFKEMPNHLKRKIPRRVFLLKTKRY